MTSKAIKEVDFKAAPYKWATHYFSLSEVMVQINSYFLLVLERTKPVLKLFLALGQSCAIVRCVTSKHRSSARPDCSSMMKSVKQW